MVRRRAARVRPRGRRRKRLSQEQLSDVDAAAEIALRRGLHSVSVHGLVLYTGYGSADCSSWQQYEEQAAATPAAEPAQQPPLSSRKQRSRDRRTTYVADIRAGRKLPAALRGAQADPAATPSATRAGLRAETAAAPPAAAAAAGSAHAAASSDVNMAQATGSPSSAAGQKRSYALAVAASPTRSVARPAPTASNT